MSFIDDIKYKYQNGSPLIRLIIINVAVFVATLLIRISFMFSGKDGAFMVNDYLGIPLDVDKVLYRFWTPITYMFIHANIWHILWNMLFLYWFGEIVNNLIGRSKITAIYFYGGIAGALLALLLSLTPLVPNLPLVGASGAVNAIMFAAVTLAPNYEFNLLIIGRIKIKYIAAFKIVMDLAAISINDNSGGSICHIGGALFGWFFITQLRNGNDWSVGFNRFLDSITGIFSSRPKMKVVHKSKSHVVKKKTSSEENKQKRLDEILDKISKSGYPSLTEEEKEFLFRASND